MEHMQFDESNGKPKMEGETVVELLVDLDILCRKLEHLGKETLIFCSGSDTVITSTAAALFFKDVDSVFAKFKDFCSTHQPAAEQTQPYAPVKPAFENFVQSETVLKTSQPKLNPEDDAFPDCNPLVIVQDGLMVDCQDEDADDGSEDYVLAEQNSDEIRGITDAGLSRTVENETKNIEKNVDNIEGISSPQKRYLEDGKSTNGIKKTKLDGTDFFYDQKSLHPSVSLKRIDEIKNKENSSQKEKKYLEVNDERLLLMTPEESGIDFTKDENSSFNCIKCEKVSSSLSRLREHLTKFHKIKVGYQCVCGRYFQDTALYNKHIDNKLYSMYHHECEHCKLIYPSISALKSHILRAHDKNAGDIIVSKAEKLGDFPCLKCETMFHHEQHLIDHNDNLPDCDVTVKDDKTVEKDLANSVITYTCKDGKEEMTTYGEIIATKKEQPFICPCCDDLFNRRSNFQRHMLRHISQGTHLCLICGNKLKSKDGLQRHLNQHMVRPYNCSKCRNRFATQAELSDHQSGRCKDGRREDFKCDLCDHIASNMSSLKVHKNMHAGLKPFHCTKCDKCFATKSSLDRHDAVRHQEATPFSCTQCSKAFKTKDNLKKHAKVHQEPKYSCDVCGKGWVEKSSLRKHMIVHTKAKPFICEVCGKACIEKGNLTKHMRTHTQEKPFVCELCGKAYGRKSLLDNHRRLHTGEKPYKCTKEGCDKAFRSYSNLKQHLRNHSQTHPYVCDVCGKMFKQPGRLNHHRKDHTVAFRWPCAYCEEKFKSIFMYKGHLAKFHPEMKNDIEERSNIRLYECEMCHKMYGDKDDLTRHIYIHQNLKPFSCQYCSKSFNDKSNMRQHEKIHTGVKHHWCEVCKKGFIHKRDLRNHMQTNHVKDEEDVKPVREKKSRKKHLLNVNSMESQGSYTEFTPVENQDMSMLMSVDYEDNKKGVQTVIEEQPRDLTIQPYLESQGEIPMQSFPVAAVNAVTGQIEPLMIIENYQ